MANQYEVGQLYASMTVKGMGTVRAELTAMMKSVFNLRTAFAALKAGMSALAETGATFESYRKRIEAVSASVEEAGETFERIAKWAAVNPVDTADATASFVRLRTAAVQNAEEANKALGDLSAVMGVSMQDAANTLVSLNSRALRQVGVQLDQTGKKARVQIGETVLYTEKSTAKIQETIVKAIQIAYAGQMEKMKDTWTGTMNTLGGMWIDFKRQIAGDAGTGGPFDMLKSIFIDLRNKWEAFTKTDNYKKFIDDIQMGLNNLIVKVAQIGTAFLELSTTITKAFEGKGWTIFSALAGFKVGGVYGAVAGALGGALADINQNTEVKRQIQSETQTKYKQKEAQIKKEFDLRKKAREEERLALIEMRRGIPTNWSGKAKTQEGQNQLDNIAARISEISKESSAHFENLDKALKENEAARVAEESRLISEMEQKQAEETTFSKTLDAMAKEAEQSTKKLEARAKYGRAAAIEGIDADNNGGFSKSKKAPVANIVDEEKQLKAVQEQITKIQTVVKFSNKTLADYGATIDREMSKYSKYSAPWAAWADLAMQKNEEIIANAKNSAKRLIETEDWKYSQNLISADEYFQILIARYQSSYATIEELEKARGTADPKKVQAQIDEATAMNRQSYAGMKDAAVNAAQAIIDKFNAGKMSLLDAETGVNALKQKFKSMRLEVPKELQELADALDPLKEVTKSWITELKDGLADAIVEGNSLGDVFTNLGKQIEKWALNTMFNQMASNAGGFWGKLFGHHTGGIVGVDNPTFVRHLPKFHSGGIVGAGEELAVLKKGEGVFTQGQMNALGSAIGNNQPISINITVENNGSGSMSDDQADSLGKQLREIVDARVSEQLYKYKRTGYFNKTAGAF